MAHSNQRWSVPHRRVGISVALGVIGVFVLCGSIGMTNWMVGAIGLAIVAGAVGLYSISALNSRAFSYIPGTAHVVSASEPPASATRGRCNLHILVTARNISGVAVKIRDPSVPVAKWPDAGTDLPILVAVGDARRVRVLWDEVRAHGALNDETVVRQGQAPEFDDIPTGRGGDDFVTGYDNPSYVDGSSYPDDGAFTDEAVFTDDAVFADDSVFGDEAVPGDAAPLEDPAFSGDAAYADETVFEPAVAGEPVVATVPSDAEMTDDAEGYDGHDEDDVMPLTVPDGHGGQVIELDVMDPSIVRWSAESPPSVTTVVPERRRPSPRPRRAPDETIVAVSFADEVPTVPVRVHQARVVTPAVPAPPDNDEPFDQFADDATGVTAAYLAATPPPGTNRPGRIRSVAVTLFVTDLSRSIMFYRDTLGFTETDAGRGSAVLESGDARIVLRRVAMPPVDRRLVQLLLEVPDVQAGYDDLGVRGVPFIHRPRVVGRYEQHELWAAAFRDPDGHGIAITQWRSV